ncbi:MAG: hypothetical protein KDB03_16290 [Planctomycetales bacterium]|nr:hypothetical protein [Planctomycetales bacterium]
MRSFFSPVASKVLLVVFANAAISQDASVAQEPIGIGDSLKITVVEGDSLSFEFEGKVESIKDGIATVEKAQKTAVINRRWPYLWRLPFIGERLFTSIVRKPVRDSQEILIELSHE